eukprot:1156642-Pelagomonas_calceolata.AAC.3
MPMLVAGAGAAIAGAVAAVAAGAAGAELERQQRKKLSCITHPRTEAHARQGLECPFRMEYSTEAEAHASRAGVSHGGQALWTTLSWQKQQIQLLPQVSGSV